MEPRSKSFEIHGICYVWAAADTMDELIPVVEKLAAKDYIVTLERLSGGGWYLIAERVEEQHVLAQS